MTVVNSGGVESVQRVRDGEVESDYERDDVGAMGGNEAAASDHAIASDGSGLQRRPGGDQDPQSAAGHANAGVQGDVSRDSGDSGAPDEDLGELLDAIPEEARSQVVNFVAQAMSATSSWSGLLPRPEVFSQYPMEVQERMMRWNDAWSSDESKRQDKLVEAQIEQARKGPNRSLFVSLFGMALAAIAVFKYNNNIAAGIFLGPPLLLYAGSFVKSARSHSSADEPGTKS